MFFNRLLTHSAHRIVVGLMFIVLLSGCSTVAEKAMATPEEVAAATVVPTDTPEPTAAPTDTAVPTDTPEPTPAPTNTPEPTSTPTSTPHPLTGVQHQIVFASDADGDADIYVVNADGSNLRNLTDNEIPDSFPAVSADGQKIVMASIIDEGVNLFIMDMDGSNRIQLTNSTDRNFMPSWSPDGEKIAFVSDRDGDFEVYVINIDGTGLTQITHNDTEDVFPSWSPTGEWIAFSTSISGNPDIYLVRPDGTDLTQITRSNNYDGDAVTWSPDGEWLTFISERIGNKEIYAVSIADNQFGALTQTEEDEYNVQLSPDNQYLLREITRENISYTVISPLTDTSVSYNFLPDQMPAWFASWVPNPELEVSELHLTFLPPPEGFCIYETDPTFGHSVDNPMALGTARLFGGPFASTYGEMIVRGPNGEAVIFNDGDTDGSAPSAVNERGDIVAVYSYEIVRLGRGPLYLNTGDHSIPHIPTGFTCDLEWP